MASNPKKRRNIFIKKAFQWRFILGVFMLMLLSSLCSAALIYWITGGDLQAQSQTAHVNIMNAWQRLGLSILIGNIIAFVISGSIAVYVVMYASHKIAGPLYRFEVLCEQVGNGQLDTVTKLREKDQLQDLALAFSDMVNQLKIKRSKQQSQIAEITKHIDLMRADSALSPQQSNLLNDLEQSLQQIQP